MSESVTAAEMYDFSVLRTLRKGKNLTISQVSGRSGISTAVISKLERNQSRAEIDTLFKLARVFGMNATDLLRLAEQRTAQQQAEVDFSSSGFHFRRITFGNMSAYIGTAPKGTKHSKPEVHHDDYEICWILEGSVSLVLPNETHRLAAGQSVQFDAILEHMYEVHEDCKVLIIHLKKDKRF
jgi:transcriptional regulator with XRE-family HTH domain